MASAAGAMHFDREDLVKDFYRPYLYLDKAAIRKAGLDQDEVARRIARTLEAQPGIGGTVTAAEALSSKGPATGSAARVRANHHPLRSGDIYIFQQPYWFMFDRGAVAAMHGSPWAYDTHVPLVFVGPGIKAEHHTRPVQPADVAPTLSAMLQINSPAGAQGEVLSEVVHAE